MDDGTINYQETRNAEKSQEKYGYQDDRPGFGKYLVFSPAVVVHRTDQTTECDQNATCYEQIAAIFWFTQSENIERFQVTNANNLTPTNQYLTCHDLPGNGLDAIASDFPGLLGLFFAEQTGGNN